MPIGKKSLTVEVPEFIKADKSLSKAFIRGLFDTDGCISFQKSYNKNASKWQKQVRHKPTILFTTMSKSLIQSLLEMTADLGFAFRLGKPQLPKYSKTFAYRIRLEGKANVKKFFKTIKPKNPKHLAKFNAWLKQGFN